MCHVELYCVQSVTAAARNGTDRMEWPDRGSGGSAREWGRGEKKGKEGT